MNVITRTHWSLLPSGLSWSNESVTVCRRLSRVFICLFGSVGSFRVRVFVVVFVTSGKMATAVL